MSHAGIRFMIARLIALLLLAAPVAVQSQEVSLELAVPSPVIRADRSDQGILDKTAVSSWSNTVFREPPSLSTRYTLNGHTVLPYVGIGYGAGEPIDASRTMMRDNAGQSSMQEDRILRDLLGKSVMPNE